MTRKSAFIKIKDKWRKIYEGDIIPYECYSYYFVDAQGNVTKWVKNSYSNWTLDQLDISEEEISLMLLSC